MGCEKRTSLHLFGVKVSPMREFLYLNAFANDRSNLIYSWGISMTRHEMDSRSVNAALYRGVEEREY
jgi:hypothetical protein